MAISCDDNVEPFGSVKHAVFRGRLSLSSYSQQVFCFVELGRQVISVLRVSDRSQNVFQGHSNFRIGS